MSLQEFCNNNVANMIAAILRGEAPLSGALNDFAKLTYSDRRKAGKFGRRIANGLGRFQTGVRTYLLPYGKARLAIFE